MGRTWRAVSWTLLGLLFAGAVVEAFLANWRAAFLFGGYLAALVLFMVGLKRIPPPLELLVVAVAILNAAAWVWNLYRGVILLDRFIHCVTTLAAAVAVFPYLYAAVYEPFRRRPRPLFAAVITLGAALGAWYEIVEFMMFRFFSSESYLGGYDAIMDLAMDTLGAVFAAVILHLYLPRLASFRRSP